jgi:hypothetical protein
MADALCARSLLAGALVAAVMCLRVGLESSQDTAQKYMASRAQAHETQAMAISVSALAHIGASDLALTTTRGLLYFPYDADVAYTVRYMKDWLEHPGSPDALALAGDEHAAIVHALSQPGPLTAAGRDAVISTGATYASAWSCCEAVTAVRRPVRWIVPGHWVL